MTTVTVGSRSTGQRTRMITDRAETIIVLAKEPLPGRAKTRLHSAFSPGQASALAAAALEDTLGVVRAMSVRRRILAWEGNPGDWGHGFEVVDQGPGSLADRLGRVFDHALTGAPETPTLLIAMDTPQVTRELLSTSWDGADAVIGLTEDGGYWGIGLRHGPAAGVFDSIPMSTDRTGAAQVARLLDLGYRIKLLPPLRDVDTPDDAARIADDHPLLGFSRLHRQLIADRGTVAGSAEDLRRIFDHAYHGRSLEAHTGDGVDPLRIAADLWHRPADGVDLLVVARCQPPVLDLGCGPGRMVAALTESGRSALGIDLSAAAVGASNRRGAPALRRDLSDPLPGEGRWGTVLLMDSNLGLGGDPDRLLRRCMALVASGGLIICETDPDPYADETHRVLLRAGAASGRVRWARIGIEALAARARRHNLVVAERWSADGRTFAALRTL
jgi:glycosyltransferase A (GT-A) superfamily protein (DUF2064 family)